MAQKSCIAFEEAREFVRALGLSSYSEWRVYYKSGNKPDSIPTTPNRTYKDQWQGWGDWLGTGTVAVCKREYIPFEEARRFVRLLGIKNQKEWYTYCQSGNKPDTIPVAAWRVYKEQWISCGDWLGTGTIAPFNREYLPFEEAMVFVRALGIKNEDEWRVYCKSDTKPDNIPSTPGRVYKDQWQGWGDWLGTGTIASFNREYLPFEEARVFVRLLGLKGVQEWRDYCTSGKKLHDIPSSPDQVYKNQWRSYGDWLGTGTIAYKDREHVPFEHARAFVHTLGIKSYKEWKLYCKSGNKQNNLPIAPDQFYREQWRGWGDWLGTGTIAPFNREYLPFEEARKVVHMLGIKNRQEWKLYCKSGNKPDSIPVAPDLVYKEQWQGDADWLRDSKRITQTRIEREVGQELLRRGETYVEQHRIGRYVVDFWLASWNLILECDGCYWHGCLQCGFKPPKKRDHDRLRNQFLERQGYRVARLWEHAIMANVKDAVDSVFTQLL